MLGLRKAPSALVWLLVGACGATASLHAQFTEVPTTVPVGTWQIEADIGSVSWDTRTLQRDGVSERVWSVASTLLSTGIGPGVDVQIGYEPYLRYSYTSPSGKTVHQGRGDTYLRTKWNFIGDETQNLALAVLPYLKLPTNRNGVGNGRVEGGLIVPFGIPVGENTSISAMASADWVDDGTGHSDILVCASGVFSCSVGQCWGVYGEAGAVVNTAHSGSWSGVVGIGVTWAQSEKLSWDLAGYTALTRAAPDCTAALRIVWIW